jgi:hypothetical protein
MLAGCAGKNACATVGAGIPACPTFTGALSEAIALILEDRREDARRGVPAGAERGTVIVEPSMAHAE